MSNESLLKHIKECARHTALLVIVCLLFGCGGSGGSTSNTERDFSAPISSAPVSTNIPTASANEVGLNASLIESTYQKAASDPDIFSLLVLKNNQLVGEAYFNNSSVNSLRHVRSVTKTVTALLTGIALDRGLLISTEQTVGEIIGQDYPSLSADKRDITIEHLLTMTSGFDWNESAYLTWEGSQDPVNYLLSRPLSETPGEIFLYNSAGVHLLAVILDKVTEGELREFADEFLFAPLSISNYRWDRLNDGRVNGGAGLQLMPIDTAKLALLLLNNGLYNDTQIVSEQWLVESKKLKTEFTGDSQYGSVNFTGYGYLWWQGTGANTHIDLAWGWGGQFIASIPEHDLIVITNSRHNVANDQADRQEIRNLALITDGILPALN